MGEQVYGAIIWEKGYESPLFGPFRNVTELRKWGTEARKRMLCEPGQRYPRITAHYVHNIEWIDSGIEDHRAQVLHAEVNRKRREARSRS